MIEDYLKGNEVIKEEQLKKLSQLHIDLHQTFGTQSGARVMKWLEEICFKYQTTFVDGNKDLTHINEGQRRVLLSIENMMVLEFDKGSVEKKEE